MADGMTVAKSLHIDAAPGFPVCARCCVPLVVQVADGGRVATTCPSCSDAAIFALPQGAGILGGALVAVVAQEHRTNRVHATEGAPTETGISVLACPNCGAPLSLEGSDRTIKCQ